MEFCPIQSYYKSTLVQLYDNEGEVNWSIDRLMTKINNDKACMEELIQTGYKANNKSFTAQQVSVVFNFIGKPLLNRKNKKLLKIKDNEFSLLNYFITNPENLTNTGNLMAKIDELDNAILSDLGLRMNNELFFFKNNQDFYFKRFKGFFEMYKTSALKCIEKITTTKDLIKTLIKINQEPI